MSLLCRLFGHKWREFVPTGTRLIYTSGMYGLEVQPSVVGTLVKHKFCQRCGAENPSFKE